METKKAFDKAKELYLQKEKELEKLKGSLKSIGKNYLEGELYLVCVTCGKECSSLGVKGHWSRYLFREYGQNKKARHIPKKEVQKLEQRITRGKERRKLLQQKEETERQLKEGKIKIEELLNLLGYLPEEERLLEIITYQTFKTFFKNTFQKIDQAQRRKGLIPINLIFEEIANSLDKDQFNQYLEKMFRDRFIELIPAYPTDLTKKQMDQAIYLESFGKRYYSVRWRD